MSPATVITGFGVVASNGVGAEAFARSLAEGRSGIGDLVSFDASDMGRERAAEILNFDPAPFLRSPKNYLDRNSALSFAACEMAVRESRIQVPNPAAGHGLAMGSMSGNMESLATFESKLRDKGPRLAPPFLFPHTYYNTTAGLLSIEYGLGGPHMQFCSGPAAGLEALAYAASCIERRRADAFLAGGAEAFGEWIFRIALGRGWLSPCVPGEESCMPFARRRNGSILGEGAAFFVVESETAAAARGADALARIAGHAVASNPRDAMSVALARAGIAPSEVHAIFACAGGYLHEDAQEAEAIIGLFGGSSPPVSALKGLIGETLGASGPIALAAALATLRSQRLPSAPSDDCAFGGLNICGATTGRFSTILINAGSPGEGRWVSLILKRV